MASNSSSLSVVFSNNFLAISSILTLYLMIDYSIKVFMLF